MLLYREQKVATVAATERQPYLDFSPFGCRFLPFSSISSGVGERKSVFCGNRALPFHSARLPFFSLFTAPFLPFSGSVFRGKFCTPVSES